MQMQRQIAEAEAEAEAEADSIAKLHLGVLHAEKSQKFSPAAGSPATERSSRYACGKNPKFFARGGLSTDRVLGTLRVQ